MKKREIALSLLLIFVLALTACTTGPQTSTGGLKIAMVTDEGGVNDQSFNQSAWEGLQQAKKDLGVHVSYQESKQEADYVPHMETLLEAKNDLIWGVGYKLADAVMGAATANPDTKYGIVDHDYGDKTPSNVVCVVFQAEQPSFLVGYIAGRMTQTNQLGFVGGIEGDVIWGFDYGYQAGAQYAAKELGKEITVLSQYADSFGDSAKGKAIATTMYQKGIDVVFHAAGGVGDGVIEAANEQKKWVIGVDRDQSYLAPEYVLTSAMKRVDVGIYNVVKDLKDGKFEGGGTVSYGLADGGAVDIAPTSDKHVPADILKDVENLKKDIIDGKIVVPYNAETYKTFMDSLK
ncbi:MAG: BMP family ABC transporter substrate-binding protein [Epulopiscium sp.]|nr:BMP family ABC transporter substrate-binding protein [Candidatus Epulonipiscium sp.]